MSEEVSGIRQVRIDKIKALEEKGIRPYPIRYDRDTVISDIFKNWNEEKPQTVSIAGRIKSKRVMGKASFANIEDMSGNIQVYAKNDALGAEQFDIFTTLDLGDIVGIKGESFTTQKGEKSIKVSSFTLLAKCLRPLPSQKEKDGQIFFEFADKEMKYRQRYVDLIVSSKTRNDFIIRSKAVSSIRRFLEARGFLEVETPMMHSIVGGAAAKPPPCLLQRPCPGATAAPALICRSPAARKLPACARLLRPRLFYRSSVVLEVRALPEF